MKSFKLIIAIFGSMLILLVNSSISHAQKSHFTVSLSPVFPLSFNQDARIGLLSGRIGYRYDLTKKISWCISAAYNKFGSKTVTFMTTDDEYESKLAYIPVTSGIQLFFNNEGTRGYFVANVGYYFPGADFVKGDWGISPGFGIQIPIKNSKMKVDISLLYNGVFGSKTKVYKSSTSHSSSEQWSTYHYLSYLALNIGLVFGK